MYIYIYIYFIAVGGGACVLVVGRALSEGGDWTPTAWRMVARLCCCASLCVCMLCCLSGPPGKLTGWLIPVASLPWPDGRLPPQPMNASKKKKNNMVQKNLVLTCKNNGFCKHNIKQPKNACFSQNIKK